MSLMILEGLPMESRWFWRRDWLKARTASISIPKVTWKVELIMMAKLLRET